MLFYLSLLAYIWSTNIPKPFYILCCQVSSPSFGFCIIEVLIPSFLKWEIYYQWNSWTMWLEYFITMALPIVSSRIMQNFPTRQALWKTTGLSGEGGPTSPHWREQSCLRIFYKHVNPNGQCDRKVQGPLMSYSSSGFDQSGNWYSPSSQEWIQWQGEPWV